jgi:hypothetical protein
MPRPFRLGSARPTIGSLNYGTVAFHTQNTGTATMKMTTRLTVLTEVVHPVERPSSLSIESHSRFTPTEPAVFRLDDGRGLGSGSFGAGGDSP